jgi:hypothetical protein
MEWSIGVVLEIQPYGTQDGLPYGVLGRKRHRQRPLGLWMMRAILKKRQSERGNTHGIGGDGGDVGGSADRGQDSSAYRIACSH